MAYIRFLLPVALLFLVACSEPHERLTLSGPNGQQIAFSIEVADDDPERAKGLMDRPSLLPGEGMLFVFPSEKDLTFWMSRTLIPLDILFFDGEGNFVGSASMTPCVDPCTTIYSSGTPSAFALEVNEGFLRSTPLGQGWKIDRRLTK